ncbi:response regulator transcription factor [Amorphoplanes nipponensis]|uniref:DNA-binding response regulator n=1 Tax=Actinoplanes nipponensis TaxID=135950 RepID=A0A919JBK9_9ACTN|nr:response regulator transcription factor [Actinoplanes nipponensis]GIE47366.1 DNA-binding response regulator [Actinoplanes nipponensis]
MNDIRIVLVDDHALVRQGVRELLETEPDLKVIGEAGDSETAVGLVSDLRPDVVLLDVEIIGDDVTTTVERMRTLAPQSQILILSMYDGPQLLRRLLALNIRGYLLKSAGRAELVAAVRAACSGDDRIILGVSRRSLAAVHAPRETASLSAREREVLELTAMALTNAQIAARLYVTEATVKRHLSNVFAKLGALSRIDAVKKAIEMRIIQPPRGPGGRPDHR